MFNKKAQGISITTIIIAAIALVVLVVLVAVFTGKMRFWIEEVEECENKGGQCMELSECKEKGYRILGDVGCKKRFELGELGVEGDTCCMTIQIETP